LHARRHACEFAIGLRLPLDHDPQLGLCLLRRGAILQPGHDLPTR
jgi:hypothetical protein